MGWVQRTFEQRRWCEGRVSEDSSRVEQCQGNGIGKGEFLPKGIHGSQFWIARFQKCDWTCLRCLWGLVMAPRGM